MTLLWNKRYILDYFNEGEEAWKLVLLSGYEDKNDQGRFIPAGRPTL